MLIQIKVKVTVKRFTGECWAAKYEGMKKVLKVGVKKILVDYKQIIGNIKSKKLAKE